MCERTMIPIHLLSTRIRVRTQLARHLLLASGGRFLFRGIRSATFSPFWPHKIKKQTKVNATAALFTLTIIQERHKQCSFQSHNDVSTKIHYHLCECDPGGVYVFTVDGGDLSFVLEFYD